MNVAVTRVAGKWQTIGNSWKRKKQTRQEPQLWEPVSPSIQGANKSPDCLEGGSEPRWGNARVNKHQANCAVLCWTDLMGDSQEHHREPGRKETPILPPLCDSQKPPLSPPQLRPCKQNRDLVVVSDGCFNGPPNTHSLALRGWI